MSVPVSGLGATPVVADQRAATVSKDATMGSHTACHGPEGTGDQSMGAPDLVDAIWLYGGDRETLTATITNARYGVMPSWGSRLDPVTVKMLAAYVHSLGGGEARPARLAAADKAVPPDVQH